MLLLGAMAGAGALAGPGASVGPSTPLRGADAPAPPPGSISMRVSPLHDVRGLHPGLTAVPADERGAARKRLATVAQAPRGSGAGYQRVRDFGPAWTDDVDITWGHDGCRTREEILHRDVKAPDLRAGTHGCVVLTGILQEPYLGKTVEFTKQQPDAIQIDHVVPLSYAWRQGARAWAQGRREQLANDPLNLLAVDGPANGAKSDSGPARWLPPNRAVRCAYVVRFGLVALKYALPVTPADRRAMLRACRAR